MFKYLRSYLRIKWFYNGVNIKNKVDTLYPLSASVFIFVAYSISYFYFDKKIQFFFRSEVFKVFINLFIALPGFYIAALAACLTITNPYFTKVSSKNNLKGVITGDYVDIPIRMFFTTAFSYLTYLSFLVLIIYSTTGYIYEIGILPIDAMSYFWITNFINTYIVFFILRILLITLTCVSYLGDRAQR